jgi:hypothetical protein
MGEQEDEVNATSLVTISTLIFPTPSSQVGGHSLRLKMENQDSTLRLPMFHLMGINDVEKNWFTCESIRSMKRITKEETKIAQL